MKFDEKNTQYSRHQPRQHEKIRNFVGKRPVKKHENVIDTDLSPTVY